MAHLKKQVGIFEKDTFNLGGGGVVTTCVIAYGRIQ